PASLYCLQCQRSQLSGPPAASTFASGQLLATWVDGVRTTERLKRLEMVRNKRNQKLKTLSAINPWVRI
ncbi:MAG: hypothetical protein ACKO68_02625, partial [Bacteroidota bacterium]